MAEATNKGKKIVSGVIWSYGEKIGAELVGLIVGIILARLLEPEHYGSIALVTVFISIANTFVTSGFGTALIQKKDADSLDFSSTFYFSFSFSVLLYFVIYCCAPLVANYYKNESLVLILRVMALRLPIASINSIQRAYVSKKLIFKKFFWATLGGTIVAAIAGISMAYMGFGVWALVAQYLINATIDTIILFITVKWYPKLEFSLSRAKYLFSYGWKILMADLLNSLYSNLSNLLIAKKYSSTDLAFYTRGYNYPRLVSDNIISSVSSVVFPVFSEQQDNLVKVKSTLRTVTRVMALITAPMLLGFAAVATPLVELLLTEKWLPCAIYIKIMCIVWMLQPIQSYTIQAIKAIGQGGAFLKLEFVKKAINLCLLLIAVFAFNNPIYIAISLVMAQVVSIGVNMPINKLFLGYSYKEQLLDYLPTFFCAAIMWLVVSFIPYIVSNLYLILVLQITVGAVVYTILSIILTKKSIKELIHMAKILRKK